MVTVLVTGGAGFIGSHVVDRLLGGAVVVRILDNLATGSLGNLHPHSGIRGGRRLEVMLGDIRDERVVRKAMRQVDCVFHLAALPAGDRAEHHQGEMHAVNVQGTLNVLQAAVAEGARRVVFASCGSVYGPAGPGVVTEDSPLRPASQFAASKLAGEIYCRAYSSRYGIDTVLLRYFTVYGPRQRVNGSVVPSLLDSLRRGVPAVIDGDGQSARDFLHVDDAASATAAACTAPEASGLSLNIASGQSASAVEIIGILNRLLGTDLVPCRSRTPSADAAHARVSPALAGRVLGWSPAVSLVSGLSRFVRSGADDQSADSILAEVGSVEERADL